MVEIVKYLLMWWLTLPHLLVYLLVKNKETITIDIDRWASLIKPFHKQWFRTVGVINGGDRFLVKMIALSWLLVNARHFRNVYYLRVGAFKFFLLYLKRESTLFIHTRSENFGAGTYIQHGFSTIITASHIGNNCWINQQVTIGYSESRTNGYGQPFIGDNTRIGAGAKVLGNIKVGDNCIVGANTVVVKDVPDNTTVVSSPTMVIRENDEPVYHKL